MASDVVRGGRVDRRSSMKVGLVLFAIMAVVALGVAVDDPGSSESRVMVPGLLAVGALVLWSWGWGIPWVTSSWAVEIGPDAIRWHGGWRRRDRVVPRAQVVAMRRGKSRFSPLGFFDAAGKRVGVLPLFHFPSGRVMAALRRHDWPVPELEDLTDPLSRWR